MQPTETQSKPDYTAVTLIGVLGAAEVAILYVLIAVETPLSPIVQRALTNPFGLFAVVMSVVTLLIITVAGVLTLRERSQRRNSALGTRHS